MSFTNWWTSLAIGNWTLPDPTPEGSVYTSSFTSFEYELWTNSYGISVEKAIFEFTINWVAFCGGLSCPGNQIYDPETTLCDCESNYLWNETLNICVQICPANMVINY